MLERIRRIDEAATVMKAALAGSVLAEVLAGRAPEGAITILTADWEAIAAGMRTIDVVKRQTAAREIRLLITYEYGRTDREHEPGPGETEFGENMLRALEA